MPNTCQHLDKLSAERRWDDVFRCLNIDVNSTIELGSLQRRRSTDADDRWLDDYKATTNSLEAILAVILLFDQLFYFALLWYLLCFALKFLRHRGMQILKRLVDKALGSGQAPAQPTAVQPATNVTTHHKKKSITFAKGTAGY